LPKQGYLRVIVTTKDACMTNWNPKASSAMRCAGLLAVAMLAGCASTSIDTQYVDPQFAGTTLQGARVLVACDASDAAVRRLCQDQLAAEVIALGATAVPAPEIANPSPGRQGAAEHLLPAARAANAKAVFSASAIPDALAIRPGPAVGIGLGGFGGGGFGGGVGISVPVGGVQRSIGYSASATLTDVATGKLMWSARASTPASDDVNGQVSQLTRTVAKAAQKSGFF
jgi:hypothetical protein